MFRFLIFTTLLATSVLGTNYARKGYGGYKAPAAAAPAPEYAPEPEQVQLAVNSKNQVQYVDVPSSYAKQTPLRVEVPAGTQPVNFVLRSKSSPLNIETAHEGSGGSYKETSSEDAPDVRVHTVTRPVYHEVREIIAPYRKVQQQIQPVQEISEQTVAREGPKQEYAPKPTYAQPKPTYAQPKQTYAQPKKAAYTQPKQTYAQPKQTYTQPKQTYTQTYTQPKQTYQKPKVVVTQPKPTYANTGYAKPASPSYQARRRYTDTY